MGCIYIIKNTENSKVYIGQTIGKPNSRFRQHKACANNCKYQSKLYRNMREIGIDKFYVEPIVNCDDKDLNKYEQYYVEQYDSIKNGYNSVYPCSSISYKHKNKEADDKIVELYMNNVSLANIAIQLNLSIESVTKVIRIQKLHGEKIKGYNDNSSVTLVMYSSDFEILRAFNSKSDAFKYCQEVEGANNSSMAFYSQTKVACQNGNIAYGHRWQLASDLVYEGKIFRTKFDKEAYIEGKTAYQPEGKQYYIVDGALNRVKTFYKEKSKKDEKVGTSNKSEKGADKVSTNKLEHTSKKIFICKQCKREVEYLNTGDLCISYYNVKIKGKSPKPSKEELKALLDQGLQKKQIAELYGRTPSTIHYWINSHDLR